MNLLTGLGQAALNLQKFHALLNKIKKKKTKYKKQ